MSGFQSNKANIEQSSSNDTEKPERSSLVELKNGKVVFKQKPTSLEKQSETLQEIVRFREMLEKRLEQQDPPLADFPDEHKPLIAKLVHESDKTLTVLAKHIRQELMPTQDDDDDAHHSSRALASLTLAVVEAAIKSVATRTNYGLDSGNSGGKAPASICVWRWEVKEQHRDWLPKNAREKAETRLAERIQAKKDLIALFESLPQEERDTLIGSRGNKQKESDKSNVAGTSGDATEPESKSASSSRKQQKMKSAEEENDAQSDATPSVGRPRKPQDADKAAKEKEKLERKAAKAEKEKKAKDAQNKSRSLMMNFFAKTKTASLNRESPSKESVTSAGAGPSTEGQSEFQKTFKPFVVKKDARIAPVNWFLEKRNNTSNGGYKGKGTGTEDDVIVIDNDAEVSDVQMMDSVDVSRMTTSERLRSILSSLSPSVYSSRAPPHNALHLKTQNPDSTVKSLLNQLSEAEMADDVPLVRTILFTLSDRTTLPAKVFIFCDDARPGYFGTWTRSSSAIRPRNPFARDLLKIDYGYDSGEEWEEEANGEADDVVKDSDDEDIDMEDADSDLDSFLVDDDEVESVAASPSVSPSLRTIGLPLPKVAVVKRKAMAEETDGAVKLGKKRRNVVPLVPFAKGPCWESSIGHCEYDPFKPYRIQMFNDTPIPIDPFTWIPVSDETMPSNHRNVSSSDIVFAVPYLPNRLTGSSSALSTSSSSASVPPSTSTAPSIKRPPAPPKTSFPEAYVPFLLTKITQLQAPSITFLVDSIYQELKGYKIKKNAIEIKVRELGEKCKEKKYWVVKQSMIQS